MNDEIVTRFAPSPSGFLHVGGARTAIFNWIFAKQNSGRFLLRIEDTDQDRSKPEFVRQIVKSLLWLGINWDEPPLIQSSRQTEHISVINQLVNTGAAYYCFCAKDQIKNKKESARNEGKSDHYDQTCRNLSPAEIEKNISDNKPFVVRLKVPEGTSEISDLVHGNTKFDNTEIEDFIIQRSDRTPVYQLAVVADDHYMRVSHVIRGDDHFTNTKKQVLIYQALGWDIPVFAHLPLILGPDKSRLSKRHGSTSVEEFRKNGILPEALFNYLCLLGWSPGNDEEILPKAQVISLFSLDKINKSNAVFDHKKLAWMNTRYISSSDAAKLFQICEIDNRYHGDKNLLALIDLVKLRAKTPEDLKSGLEFYFVDPKDYEPEGIQKILNSPHIIKNLPEVKNRINGLAEYSAVHLEKTIREYAEEKQIKAGAIIHPVRLAVTGKTSSPGIFEVLEILGRNKSEKRINNFIKFLNMNFEKLNSVNNGVQN